MKNKLIFLDDERFISDVTWIDFPSYDKHVIVRNFNEFKEACKELKNINGKFIFSFDHDLQDYDTSGKENTGYDCIKWLCDFMLDNSINHNNITVLFHSKNPIGVKNMQSYYMNFLENCYE